MTFSTISFTGTVSGSVPGGLGTLVTTGTFDLSVSGSATGAVTGTWSFTGAYDNHNPYYPNFGQINVSGLVSGPGGQSGPWALTLAGKNAESQGLTLTYADGHWSLGGQSGFVVDYTVQGGYDFEISYHDHYRFATTFSEVGNGPASSAGTDGADIVTGTASNETLLGLAGNHTITGGGGNDTIDGGTRIDTAVFSDARANYTISHTGSTWT